MNTLNKRWILILFVTNEINNPFVFDIRLFVTQTNKDIIFKNIKITVIRLLYWQVFINELSV